MMIFGYDIISVPHMCDVKQKRTHRKKRINKKWRKRYGMKKVPQKEICIDTLNRKIYGHPERIDALKLGIEQETWQWQMNRGYLSSKQGTNVGI